MMNEWILSSSLLIAAVLLGRCLLRGRISLKLQYGLWLAVLIRLLVPVQIFTSDFGAGSIAADVDIAEPVRQVYVSAREDLYEREYDAAYRQVVAEYQAALQDVDPVVLEREAQTRVAQKQELDLKQLLYGIWSAGMVVMTSVIVSCNVHLGLHLKRRRWEYPDAGSLLPVYVTEAVPTPCIFGLFHPAIYLTPEAASDDRIRTHVLTHELTHYRHGDHIWSVLRSVCLILHWYNPLVWIAARVSRADAELACDEGALEKLGEEHRADYGRTLIGLTCPGHGGTMFVTATTMTGSAGSIRERIKLLMKRPRNTLLALTAVILVGAIVIGCTFAGAPETSAPTEPMGHEPQDWTSTDLAYALPMERAMEDYADKAPRELTEQELTEFRAAFDTLLQDGTVNPAACFLLPYYDDISEMDGGEFLAYFPRSREATREEFDLLKQKYPDFFRDWSWDELPVPIHCYEADAVEAAVSRYGNIHWTELAGDVHYLEETGCYYNYTSDFGLGGFTAREGFVYDGGAVVYSDHSALFLTENAGNYTIQAHMPVIEQTTAASTDLLRSDGMIVFPGTEWNMTEAEVLEALNIREYGVFSGIRGFLVPEMNVFGRSARVAFCFDRNTADTDWGLSSVSLKYENGEDFDAVRTMLLEQLGSPDFQTSGVAFECWRSDVRVEELVSPEAFEAYQQSREFDSTENEIYSEGAASTVSCFGAGMDNENTIRFEGWVTKALQIDAAIAPDQTAEVRALFGEGGDPWYLAALAAPYADDQSFDPAVFFSAGQTAVALTDAEKAVITERYGKDALNKTVFRMTEGRMDQVLGQYVGTMVGNVDLSEFAYCHETGAYLLVRGEVPALRSPEILSCQQLAENQVRMIYRFPGEEQRYCATVLKGETWKVYSNHLLLEKPQDARPLTEQEAATVRLSFSASYYDAAADEAVTNPRAAFLLDMYSDISEMSRSKFLSYYPASELCEDEAEFQLLKQKYPLDFENEQTLRDMNWPIHRIPASELEAVMAEYTLTDWEDLPDGGGYHYLEETDCYYTYYSDVGLFGFHCTGGWVYDGGAMLVNSFSSPMSVLLLTERDGSYYIQAHLPAMVAE